MELPVPAVKYGPAAQLVAERQNHCMTSDPGPAVPDSSGSVLPSGAANSGAPGPDQEVVVRPAWTLLTNHGHVLLAVAGSTDARVTDIAARVGITTRATLSILKDLEDAGYLTRHRVGRRSHYTVNAHQHFRHPATAGHEVGELLAIFVPDSSQARAPNST